MQQKRLRQVLIAFSLFMLLVLPTAIVGYSNFSSLVNKAFGKPFVKNDSTFIVQTESSANISKGSQFSLKVTGTTPKTIPFKYVAAFIEFDKTKVDIKSVIAQNQNQFKVVAFQNGFLVYPASMVKPAEYKDLLPQACHDAKTCDFGLSASTVSFSINGILLNDLTEQQRPVKITLLGAAEAASTYLWNEKIVLPGLSLGTFIRNTAPKFTSDPVIYTKIGTEYRYSINATDTDNDPVVFSLTCPELVFCSKQSTPPEGLTLEGSDLVWKNPRAQKDPYTIVIYANDGKSVTTQTFNLHVLDQSTSYFSCTFTPAVSVKLLDYRVTTPLVIVAESSEKFAKATVTLSKDGVKEKEFAYTFAAAPTSVILDQSSDPALKYQFNEGSYTGSAVFTSVTGQIFTCELDNPTVSLSMLLKETFKKTIDTFAQHIYAFAAVTVGANNPPTWTSNPMLPAASGGSSPSVSFVYGTAYSFTLRAQDADGDPLQYTVVTKPSWAQLSISATNPTTGASTLAIQITGVPQAKDAGSNLFSFSVNDGLGHYTTRTWVINVDYPNNDIPRVTVTQPKSAISRIQGQPFLLGWDADDRQQLMSFGVYYTKSLSSTSMTAYNKNLAYNVRSITVNTKSIPPGDYYFVVTATDSFTPAATGKDYTALVRIVAAPKPTPTPKPTVKPTSTPTATTTPTVTTTITPTPTTTEPVPQSDELSLQVTTPQNQAEIAQANFQIVATFTASSAGTVDKKDIKVVLDGTNISQNLVYQPDTGKAITGTYLPKAALDAGVHELLISATDSKRKSKDVKITFTIKDSNSANSDTVSLFGFDVTRQLYTIFIIAVILIAIGLILPIIMYFAFRRSNNDIPTTRKPVNPQPPQGAYPQLRTPNTGFATVAPVMVRPATMQGQPIPTPQAFTPIAPVSPHPQFQPQHVATPMPVVTQPYPQQPIVRAAGPQISPEDALKSFVSQAPTSDTIKPATTVTQVAPSVPVKTNIPQSTPTFQTAPKVAPTAAIRQPMPRVEPQMIPQKEIKVPQNLPPELKTPQAPATIPNNLSTPPRNAPIITPMPKTAATQSAESIPQESPSLPSK